MRMCGFSGLQLSLPGTGQQSNLDPSLPETLHAEGATVATATAGPERLEHALTAGATVHSSSRVFA